jgi:probable F420-dependent oxidoreductase
MKMKVGTWLPNFAYDADDGIDHSERLKHWIVRSEELGFDSIWVTDHLLRAKNMYARTWLEPLTSLAFAASITEKPLLGPGVLLMPLRHPVLLAKEVASIQRLSKGRFVLGAGTGWYPLEFQAVGTDKTERGRRTDEGLEIVRRLLSGETLTYEGEFFKLNDVQIEPSPVKVPVWVGGGSQVAHPDSVEKPELNPRVARRIAKADGWFARPTANPDQIIEDWLLLQPYIKAEGRSPNDIEMAHGQLLFLSDKANHEEALEEQFKAAERILGTSRPRELLQMSYLFGTIDEVIEDCRQRAETGISHFIFHPFTDDPEQLELWGRELLPVIKSLEVQPRPA